MGSYTKKKKGKLVEAKLEDVKHRLCSQFGAKGCSAITSFYDTNVFLISKQRESNVTEKLYRSISLVNID